MLSVHWRISDFYNHWRRTLLSSSSVACAVDESHTVKISTGNAGQLRIDVRSYQCYHKALQRFTWDNSEYSFSNRWFEYISTSFSQTFVIYYFYIYLPNSTNNVTIIIAFFLGRPLLAFPNVWKSSNFEIHFLVQNKKYKHSFAPTDVVTKEVEWFCLDDFDS